MEDKKEKKQKKEDKALKGKVTLSFEEYDGLKAKAEEKDQIWNKYLRLYADMENSRKLWEKQKTELLEFGNFRLMKEFTSVLDEIEAANINLKKEDTEHTRGLGMIYQKIKNILIEGVDLIPAEGKEFDPNIHEALLFQERDDLPEHSVVEVIQQGYKYGDKVLRPAKVKVSVKPQDKETEDKNQKLEDRDKDKAAGED
jgi:molecular chaperone GrpE